MNFSLFKAKNRDFYSFFKFLNTRPIRTKTRDNVIVITVLAVLLAIIVSATIYIPIAIANIDYRIPENLKSRGIDTQEKYKEYREFNRQFK
jgi:hypothetical protein